MERTTIGKKQFYGDKTLQSLVIPKGATSIGDWAFAGCSNLQRLILPTSMESIGKDAFSGCDKLEKVQFCSEESDHHEKRDLSADGLVEEMLAYALRYFQGLSEILKAAREGDAALLAAWDFACHRFLDSSDEEGFRPFLAGGEEDYADEEKERRQYVRRRRLIKAKVVILRLLESKAESEYYFSYLQKNDMALECLKSIWQQPKAVLSILEEAEILTRESCKVILEELPEENVEMRALLLQRIGADLNTVADQLWL